MSRWQIKSVLFYSHDHRRLSLDFKPSDITIIVGESYSGKSAIIEAIDYAMGASRCHIPGVVRESCSWVGVHWFCGQNEILICRRLPTLHAYSTDDLYFDTGSPIEVPKSAGELKKRTGTDGALRMFEQALLMGDVVGLTFTEREGSRISIRNAMPYILVSDDVIIDKVTLFRGMSDWKQAIVDSIPYFLGAVDETTATNEIKLKKLRIQLAKEEHRRESAALQDADSLTKAKELLIEAAEVGLLPEPNVESITTAEILKQLTELATWTPGGTVIMIGADQLTSLYFEEREILEELAQHRTNHSAAREAVKSAEAFSNAAEGQRSKLDIATLFKSESEIESCPVCNAALKDRTPTLDSIKTAIKQLDGELNEVARDRPKIDSYIRDLDLKIDDSVRTLRRIRGRIGAIIREAQNSSQRLDIDPRRMRVVGRVSFYLESASQNPDQLSDEKLNELLAEIESLEALVDPEAKAERINALQLQVSTFATEILRRLPFDKNYRAAQIMFDARKLVVKFVLGSRVMEMRDVGGDESYLSGRLSTILGLHRVFASDQRPVPGVVILDQLSRPFYNPEEKKGEVITTTSDSKDLKRYFDALFDEVTEQKTLQIVVLEHAYFQDDERYKAAVTERWNPQNRLIPDDWPRLGTDGELH